MRRLSSKKSQALFRRYCAGMLAVLMGVAYAVPSMAACPCCESMNVQPVQEKVTEAPSCHSIVPTSDGTTEEIASATEEIATQELSLCHENDAELPSPSEISPTVSNSCGVDCMIGAQTPAVASPGMIESYNPSSKVHPTIALSDLVVVNTNYLTSASPGQSQASAISSIHSSIASMPLRI